MKLDQSFLDVPDRPRFFALLIVMLGELMALGPLESYTNRPESLPPMTVPCRHSTNLFAFGSKAQYDVMLTNVTNVIWIGETNREPFGEPHP